MQTLSVAMIVKNESALLARCLDSLKGVDNIFISDTGSTDNTIEIAQRYTPFVYNDFKWNDNFADARNHILGKIPKGHYVLSIDADEVLHDVFFLREAVELMAKDNVLATMVLMATMTEKPQFFQFPRLFKRCDEVWWEGAIHNHVSVQGQELGHVIISHSYSPAHNQDPDRALRILTKEVERTGNGREMFYLGREYWYRGQYEKAIETFKQYLPKSIYRAEKADAYLFIARCAWALGQGEEARETCMRAIMLNANFQEAILFMAVICGDGSGNKLWQANADQWKKMAETANNENVLFIRKAPDKL